MGEEPSCDDLVRYWEDIQLLNDLHESMVVK